MESQRSTNIVSTGSYRLQQAIKIHMGIKKGYFELITGQRVWRENTRRSKTVESMLSATCEE
jgi:hypothetical protein